MSLKIIASKRFSNKLFYSDRPLNAQTKVWGQQTVLTYTEITHDELTAGGEVVDNLNALVDCSVWACYTDVCQKWRKN